MTNDPTTVSTMDEATIRTNLRSLARLKNPTEEQTALRTELRLELAGRMVLICTDQSLLTDYTWSFDTRGVPVTNVKINGTYTKLSLAQLQWAKANDLTLEEVKGTKVQRMGHEYEHDYRIECLNSGSSNYRQRILKLDPTDIPEEFRGIRWDASEANWYVQIRLSVEGKKVFKTTSLSMDSPHMAKFVLDQCRKISNAWFKDSNYLSVGETSVNEMLMKAAITAIKEYRLMDPIETFPYIVSDEVIEALKSTGEQKARKQLEADSMAKSTEIDLEGDIFQFDPNDEPMSDEHVQDLRDMLAAYRETHGGPWTKEQLLAMRPF